MDKTAEIQAAILEAAAQHGVDPELALAIAHAESGLGSSNFRPDARSQAGAFGAMQVMPKTATSMGANPTDPVGTAQAGVAYFNSLPGNEVDKLHAYNMGPTAYKQAKRGKRKIPAETKKYVDKVRFRRAVFEGNISEYE